MQKQFSEGLRLFERMVRGEVMKKIKVARLEIHQRKNFYKELYPIEHDARKNLDQVVEIEIMKVRLKASGKI